MIWPNPTARLAQAFNGFGPSQSEFWSNRSPRRYRVWTCPPSFIIHQPSTLNLLGYLNVRLTRANRGQATTGLIEGFNRAGFAQRSEVAR